MTENRYLLKIPVKAEKPYDDQIDATEKLIKLNDELKEKGFKHGIYNVNCMTIGDPLEIKQTVLCKVTTYGDLRRLKKEIKFPIEITNIVNEFGISEEELRQAKEFRKLYSD